MNKKITALLCLILSLSMLFTACGPADTSSVQSTSAPSSSAPTSSHDLTYNGETHTVLNDNIPEISVSEDKVESFERYSDLDELGRCGVAEACIGIDIMPTEDREPIGQIKPTGWHTVKYDIVDGKYLYNRCHLIGFQLTGENANEKNLITGTRYFNVEGMLPFENMVADYVKETKNHVMYKVTPVYDGDNLVAKGVQMEAYSVEDGGEGICFNVFVHNIQPGITIDYKTGESWLTKSESKPENSSITSSAEEQKYILNTNSKKFHKPTCKSVADIKTENKQECTGDRETLISSGYSPCKNCNP